MKPETARSVGPTDSIDSEVLDALTERLGHLEAGLRQELASQLERAERAEAALAAAQAEGATAAIVAQTEEPASSRRQSAVEAIPGATRMLAVAREEAVRIVAEARREAAEVRSQGQNDEAFRKVLIELRDHLVDREVVVGEVVGIARQAIAELIQHPELTSAATGRAASGHRNDDGGDHED